jgi:hypothetical protein
MRRRPAIAFLAIVIAFAGAAGIKGADVDRPGRSTDLPRPRDSDIAVKEELEAARRDGTVAAYDRFLARHGDHPLAAAARRERSLLATGQP